MNDYEEILLERIDALGQNILSIKCMLKSILNSDEIFVEASASKERIDHVYYGTWKNDKLESGCHSYDGYLKIIEKGYADIDDFEILTNGVIRGYVRNHPNGMRQNVRHTFFPESWNYEYLNAIIRLMIDTYRNDIDNRSKGHDLKYTHVSDSVIMTIGFRDGHLFNAYPRWDQEVKENK